MIPYKDLFIALNKHRIRYLVAGGFAVNFYHINRATADLDLIVHLEESNVISFDHMMTALGYRPRLPVSGQDLANEEIRKRWIEEKGMMVFSYIHPNHPYELIDIFVEEPKPFRELDQSKSLVPVFGIHIPVIGLDDLIKMKQEAGRDKDLFDVQQLQRLRERQRGD